ncbi:hypothetical protein [Flavobacterium foetidum]|uniref:hypothetical protein n=1 Tax=Flavobacterium foetidum TaxID=2026681 RepID=UPI00107519EB|nr:hypothetical protein [Flavobacterium foetidum]KAF2508088.1 hypothetical protein E0W73_20020 [Flavobacterium foetidum]
MFKNNLISCILILCIFSCNRVEKKTSPSPKDSLENAKEDSSQIATKAPNEEYFDYSNTVINEEFNDSIFAKFSDLSSEDKFTLNIPVGNIKETITVFKIFNSAGEVIYEKSFQTSYIINGYHLIHIKSDEELERYILDRAREILNADNLTDISNRSEIKDDPVLGAAPEDFIDYNAFLECQKEKRPLFAISLAEEDTTYLGYSDKLQKVVEVTACC